jgi:phosphate transport system substrate-binding protein
LAVTHSIFRGLIVIATMALLASCGQAGERSGAQTVRVDGSSTVFPLSEAAAEGFMTEYAGQARVSVGESGTGGGFRRFCRGETEVQGASRPILAEEMQLCAEAGVAYVETMVAFDGITVAVNLENPVNSITMEELRSIWQPSATGQITNWRQVNAAWPNQPLQLFGAGTASGTFDYFTEAVMGEARASRTDYTPTEDDNVTVLGVVNNVGGMGYFGIAYYEQNRSRLKALSIDAGSGPVAPSAESVASGAYPISRPLFVYFNAEALRRPAVARFARFYVENAAAMATRVGYVALPERAYPAYVQRISERTTGTAFGGEQEIGLSIEEVLARPLSTSNN